MKNLTPQNEKDIVALVKTHMDNTVGMKRLSVFMTHGQSIEVRSNHQKTLTKDEVKRFGFSSLDSWKKEAIQEWQYDVDELIEKLEQELGIDFESNGISPSGFTLITSE